MCGSSSVCTLIGANGVLNWGSGVHWFAPKLGYQERSHAGKP